MEVKNETVIRGKYGEIPLNTLDKDKVEIVKNMVELASNANKIDEHRTWDFGSNFDWRGRGVSLNWDLYGIGNDYHSQKPLIIIQIRQYVKIKRHYFPSIRKSYFLIGTNEDDSTFAHSIEPRVIHCAIRKGKDVILAVQNWIFKADYTKIIRQGDIGLVPVRKAVGEFLSTKEIELEYSHQIFADEIYQNGNYYVFNPKVVHLPNTHPQVQGIGWFKVIVGDRTGYWSFASPTID